MSQIGTENDKKYQFFYNFPSFHAISVNIPTNSVDWKVQNSEQGIIDPVGFSQKFIAIF